MNSSYTNSIGVISSHGARQTWYRSVIAFFSIMLLFLGVTAPSTTQATIVSTVYTQDFSSDWFPPSDGWYDDSGYAWYYSYYGANGYDGSAMIFLYNCAYGNLYSAPVDLSSFDGASDKAYVEFDLWLEMDAYSYYYGEDYLRVYVDDGEGSREMLAEYLTNKDYTFDNSGDFGYYYDPISDPAYWSHKKLLIPQAFRKAGTRIYFEGQAYYACGGNGGIDNFVITGEEAIEINYTPTALNFPTLSVGAQSGPQYITINNTSTVPVTINSAVLGGPFSASYQFVGAVPTSIPAMGSVNIGVRFVPTVNGSQYATLTINNTSDNIPSFMIPLNGIGVAPTISIIPIGSVNTPTRMFKKTRTSVGDTLSQSFLVKNIGEGALVIFPWTGITGENASHYRITRFPQYSLETGFSDTMTVQFTPRKDGGLTARLDIYNNASNGTQYIDLFGIGVCPAIMLEPGEMLTFDSVAMGVATCKTVRISNPGTDTLILTNNYLSSSDGDFTFTELTGDQTKIAPGDFREVQVCITPLQKGTRRARLRFTTNIPLTFEEGDGYDDGGDQDDGGDGSYSGQQQQGYYYEPEWIRNDTSSKSLEIWANAIPSDKTIIAMGDFSDAIVGTEATATATFTNLGSEVIVLEEPFFSGAQASSFKATKANFPLELAPGASINFTVSAAAKVRGENTAVMHIANKSEDRQYLQTVELAFTGLLSSTTVSANALEFSKLYLGESSSKTVTVTNVGDVDQTYTASVASTNGFVLDGQSVLGPITPGSSANFTVKFIPTEKGAVSNTLTVKTAHTADMVVSLSGEADEKPVTQAVTGDVAMRGFVLSQNSPNPANGSTSVSFTTPVTSDIRITLSDVTGKTVRELVSGVYGAGDHTVSVSTKGIASGNYLYILESEGVRLVRQMVITK